jgi:hypothetical protein
VGRLALGGVMVGSFAGVYLGAALGLAYSAWVGRLSPTLDGALLGGAALAVLGGGYGAILGWTERRDTALEQPGKEPHSSRASPPASRSVVPGQAPPAGSLESDRTPDMEHAHVR